MKQKFFLAVSLSLLLLSACSLTISPTVQPSLTLPPPAPTASMTASPTATVTSTPTPTREINLIPTPTEKPRQYSVILVEPDDVLNIHAAAGQDNPTVGSFPAGVTNVVSTGVNALVDGDLWLEVLNPAGDTGWVNTHFLTECVPSADFCSDPQVTTLLENLKQAILNEDGDLLASLVSPAHGLEVFYWRYGPSANYTPEEASWVFNSDYQVNWGAGASDIDDVGTFRQVPLPALLEVFNAPGYQQQCNDPSSVNMYLNPWPKRYSGINFYALHKPGTPGVDLDWATWLAGVEYVKDTPYLFALIYFQWEP